jgi:hypothetical protein
MEIRVKSIGIAQQAIIYRAALEALQRDVSVRLIASTEVLRNDGGHYHMSNAILCDCRRRASQ